MRARAPIVAVLLVALLVRFAHVADVRENPFFEHPVVDAAEYNEWARAIAGGDLLSRGKGVFWQAPLYPYFLAGVFASAGRDFLAPRIAQAYMGAAAVALLFALGRRAGGTRVALVAGLAGAFYWPWVYFDAELLPVGLHLALDLLTTWLLLRAADRPGATRRWAAAGLAAGLACLTRPTSLLLLPLVLRWIVTERASPGGKRRAAVAAAAFALAAFAVVGAVTARNAIVGGDRVLIASSGGLNFYLGNNPDYDRTVHIRPGARWTRVLMLAPYGPGVKASERSAAFYRLGLRWIAGHPREAAALYARKALLFLNDHEILRNQDPYYFRRFSRFLGPPLLGFAAIAPFAVLGVVRADRRHRAQRLLALILAGQVAGVLLFFVTARYRMAAVPYLLVFAALGFWHLVDAVRARRARAAAAGFALCGATLALALMPVRGAERSTFSREAFELGRIAEERGDRAAARRHYQEAARLDPGDPDAYVHLAIVERDLGESGAALRTLDRALEAMPDLGIAHYVIGTILEAGGEWSRAAESYRAAMRFDPAYDRAEALTRLARVLLRESKVAESERVVREALERDPERFEARLVLAMVHLAAGRIVEAEAEIRASARANPGDPRPARLLAQLRAQLVETK